MLFFTVYVFIVQLLHEEYSLMSPNTLETQGLINQNEYQKVAELTHSASPDAQKKIAGIIKCCRILQFFSTTLLLTFLLLTNKPGKIRFPWKSKGQSWGHGKAS